VSNINSTSKTRDYVTSYELILRLLFIQFRFYGKSLQHLVCPTVLLMRWLYYIHIVHSEQVCETKTRRASLEQCQPGVYWWGRVHNFVTVIYSLNVANDTRHLIRTDPGLSEAYHCKIPLHLKRVATLPYYKGVDWK